MRHWDCIRACIRLGIGVAHDHFTIPYSAPQSLILHIKITHTNPSYPTTLFVCAERNYVMLGSIASPCECVSALVFLLWKLQQVTDFMRFLPTHFLTARTISKDCSSMSMFALNQVSLGCMSECMTSFSDINKAISPMTGCREAIIIDGHMKCCRSSCNCKEGGVIDCCLMGKEMQSSPPTISV